jgi:hypothetical protein
MEPLTHLTSHNARVAQIRKFVAKPPPRGVRLRLVTADDTAESLGEWLRDECEGNANVANDVSETLQDHCNTAERPIEAILGWCAEEGNAVTTKRLRARPSNTDDLESKALGIDGSAGGQVVQMQRHLEAMTRSYLTAHQAQISSANLIATAMSDRVLTLQAQIDELREEKNELFLAQIERVLQGDGEEKQQVGPETDAARAELIRTTIAGLKTAGPLVLRQVMMYAQQQAQAKTANGS